jgi:citrate synthase
MMRIDGEDFVTAAEATRLLGVKRQTLYVYVSRGILPSFQQGMRRERLYRRRDIDELRRLRPSREPQVRHRIPWAEDWIGDK